jgi:multidrug resistance efflux pump
MNNKRLFLAVTLAMLIPVLAACGTVNGPDVDDAITASGMISADEVNISAEIGGKVEQVFVQEGGQVEAGDLLFEVEDTILLAQQEQALAAVELAQASVEAAQAQLTGAQIQYEIALQGSRLQDYQGRLSAWQTPQSGEIDTPVWYFDKDERIAALEAEIQLAEQDYQVRLANLEDVLADATNEDFIEVEVRLANAQATFNIALQTLEQAAAGGDDMEDAAQQSHDAALSELDAAQTNYDRLLTTSVAEEVLEARAQAAVAKARLQNAQDGLALLLSGEDSLQVQAATAAVTMAETALTQAEANLLQAQAALNLIAIQIDKTQVTAPVSGVILTLSVDAGELVGAGVVTMTIAQLETVELTVYIPEDVYGRISLGDEALVNVDSFPDKTYTAFVTYISGEAEFTPRNVQTAEGRTSTVYAVRLTLDNPQLELKPGMPADVTFSDN